MIYCTPPSHHVFITHIKVDMRQTCTPSFCAMHRKHTKSTTCKCQMLTHVHTFGGQKKTQILCLFQILGPLLPYNSFRFIEHRLITYYTERYRYCVDEPTGLFSPIHIFHDLSLSKRWHMTLRIGAYTTVLAASSARSPAASALLSGPHVQLYDVPHAHTSGP